MRADRLRDMYHSPCLIILCGLCLLSLYSPQTENLTRERNQLVFPGKEWEKRPAEELCLHAEALAPFTEAVGGSGVIIKNGYLIKDWGDPVGRTMWASAGKPLFSTLLFFAAQENRVAIHGKIDTFMPELLGKDEEITFHHLANMTSGYARSEWPGQAFAYNDYAIKLYHNLLFDRVFSSSDPNQIIMDKARLGPLLFQDGDIFKLEERYGWVVHASPRDFARIALFWLNKGNWNGRQILDKRFFERYLKNQVPQSLPRSKRPARDYLDIGSYGALSGNQTPFVPGNYGMNWWINTDRKIWPSLPEDTFQANGRWNKETVTVIPSMALIVAGVGEFGSFQPGPGPADELMGLVVKACGE